MNKYDIKKLVSKDNPLVLDIGCYNGKDSAELSDVLQCNVHCFEPDPLSQDMFRSEHDRNFHLKLYPFALCNEDGEIDFYQSNHPQSNSIHEPREHLNIFPAVKFDEVTKVKCMKLDTWWTEYLRTHNHEREVIDFIWADVNGAERDLILGGQQALSVTRYLYIEVSKKELYKGQQHYNFLNDLLPNFKMMTMYNWGENFGNILLKNTEL